MARTTAALVQGVLGDDYGLNLAGSLPDLIPYIAAASSIVTNLIPCQTRKGYSLTSDNMELIERWLAAHLYKMSDKDYTSRSTAGASGQFAGQTTQGFDATLYGQTAQRLDPSNCLRNLDKQQKGRGIWIGKPPSLQSPEEEEIGQIGTGI